MDTAVGASCPSASGWDQPMGGSDEAREQEEREMGLSVPLVALLLDPEEAVAQDLYEKLQLWSDSLS